VVKSFDSGAPEEYAANLGWRYEDTIPSMISVSYLLHIRDGGLNKFNVVVGGKPVKASFPFSSLLGLEKRTAGSQTDLISCTVDPANIIRTPWSPPGARWHQSSEEVWAMQESTTTGLLDLESIPGESECS
jgi:hypothetical protein